MQLHCPICQASLPEPLQDLACRPFCSPRCKLADLHSWLTGAYCISTPLDPDALDDDLKPRDDDFKLRS